MRRVLHMYNNIYWRMPASLAAVIATAPTVVLDVVCLVARVIAAGLYYYYARAAIQYNTAVHAIYKYHIYVWVLLRYYIYYVYNMTF